MTKEEFVTEIADILSADEEDISIDTVLANEDDWDSLAIISFIAMADKKLNIKVDINSIKSCKTVEDLMRIVEL